MSRRIVVLPCSGIGKAYGEIGRQAVYELVEDLRPEEATTTCLARLVLDDPEAKALVGDNAVITVDGCTQDCARKCVESTGKKVDSSLRVIEAFKQNRGLKPQGILELGEPGFKLVHDLAQRLGEEVDCLRRKEKEHVGSH